VGGICDRESGNYGGRHKCAPGVFGLSNCEGWWEGQHDEVPEQAFHMNGQN